MKKLLLTSILIVAILIVNAQVDTFRMRGNTYGVRFEHGSLRERPMSLYITCENTFDTIFPTHFYDRKEKQGKFVEIEVVPEKIDGFREFLIKVRNKYLEWSEIAEENNVTSLFKKMDIESDNYGCNANIKESYVKVNHIFYPCYNFTSNNFDPLCVNFTPYFSVKDGKMEISMFEKISNADSYNRGSADELVSTYVDLSFNSLEEINSLITCLESENLNLLKEQFLLREQKKAEEREKRKEIYDKFK